MSSPMQAQAAKVWELLSNTKFWDAYRKAISALWEVLMVTGNLLKEVAILAWLAICFVLVLGDWLWSGSTVAYGQARIRWQDLTTEKEDGQQLGTEAGQALLTASRSSLASAIAGARSQLGLPEKTQAPLDVTASPEKEKVAAATSTPVAKTEAPAKAAAPVAQPEAEAPTAAATAEANAATSEQEGTDEANEA
ncbi:MAG: hypothetical protein AAFY57_03830 [Cyanobacteria bacterium J06642_2]